MDKADLNKVSIESKVPEKLDGLFSLNGNITMIFREQILSRGNLWCSAT